MISLEVDGKLKRCVLVDNVNLQCASRIFYEGLRASVGAQVKEAMQLVEYTEFTDPCKELEQGGNIAPNPTDAAMRQEASASVFLDAVHFGR